MSILQMAQVTLQHIYKKLDSWEDNHFFISYLKENELN